MTGPLRRLVADARFALGRCLRAHRRLTVLLVGLPLVQAVLPVALVVALRGLVEAAVTVRADPAAGSGSLLRWVVLGAAVAAANVVCGAVAVYAAAAQLEWLDDAVSVDLAVHAARLPYRVFEDRDFQDTLTHINEGPAQHLQQLGTAVVGVVAGSVRTLTLLGLLLAVEPLAVALLVPLSLPYLAWQLWLSRRRYEEQLTQRTRRRWASYYVGQLTSASSLPEIRLLDLGPLFVQRIRAILAGFRHRNLRFHRLQLAGTAAFGLVSVVAVHAALYRVALGVAGGRVGVGDVAVFGAAAMALRGAIDATVGSLAGFRWHTLYVGELRTFLALPARDRPATARPDPHGAGELVIDRVSFAYPGTDRPVLHDVSLRVMPGEVVAIVGENGSGKSTLVKLVAGLYEPDRGAIRLDGVDLADVDTTDLAGVVTFVFQSIGRYEATLADNVAFGDRAVLLEDPVATRQVIERVGIAGLVDGLPDGADTLLGRRFGTHEPSGGQWQQIAIARANARPGVIQILDEPTSNLDVRTEHAIFSKFRALARGRTTILISHRLSTVMLADRIVVMAGGRIVEEGTHDELLARSGTYAELYRLHRRDRDDDGVDGGDRDGDADGRCGTAGPPRSGRIARCGTGQGSGEETGG